MIDQMPPTRIFLTVCRPSSITASSLEAQYVPRRYSSTYTGTLAPSLTSLVRSLRTTLPGKCRFSRSSSPLSITWLSEIIGERPVDYYFHALLLDAIFRVLEDQPIRRLLVVVSVLQDEVDPLFAFVQVSGSAIELDGLDIGHGLLTLIDG